MLLKTLQLGHVLLESGQLLLIGDGVLLQSSEGGLILLFQLTLLQHLLLELLVQLLQLLQLGQLLAVLLEGSLQLALFALISSIAATSIGSGNVLLVVDNLPTRFGLWPFRRGQIGQIGHIPNGRRWVAGRCGQGHCGRQYSLPRRWS